MGSTWHDLAQPRLNIGSGEAQMEAKMGQHASKMAPLGHRWIPRVPTSANMAQDGASEGPRCPQQGGKIVKYALVLLILGIMSQNIVFPTVFAWFVARDSAQDEPRWTPRQPKRAPRWSQEGQVGAKMSPT